MSREGLWYDPRSGTLRPRWAAGSGPASSARSVDEAIAAGPARPSPDPTVKRTAEIKEAVHEAKHDTDD